MSQHTTWPSPSESSLSGDVIHSLYPLREDSTTRKWIPAADCHVDYPVSEFYKACQELIRFPERNTPSILRTDILHETDIEYEKSDEVKEWISAESCNSIKKIRRLLLPRKSFDGSLEQTCYVTSVNKIIDANSFQIGVCLFIPHYETSTCSKSITPDDSSPTTNGQARTRIPFYHPRVSAIAIHYSELKKRIFVEYLPHPEYSLPVQQVQDDSSLSSSNQVVKVEVNSRLYKMATGLLSNISRYANGYISGYQKRVHHDVIVPREMYQDLYMQMKDRWTWVVSEWLEKTDPRKHVFEDVAIGAYIICLWKIIFEDGRPPGGFVDIGAGNGLLVHILSQEGYQGQGIELRSRKSWELWQRSASNSGIPTILKEQTLNPPEIVQQGNVFKPGTFFIGNHADEMTPWIPLLAASIPGGSFINIPCCLHTLSGRFTPNAYNIPDDLLQKYPESNTWFQNFQSITSEGGGRYNAYQKYLFELSLKSAFIPEREALRIPSVSNDPDISPDPGDVMIKRTTGLKLKTHLLTKCFMQTRNIAIIGRFRVTRTLSSNTAENEHSQVDTTFEDPSVMEAVKLLGHEASTNFEPRSVDSYTDH